MKGHEPVSVRSARREAYQEQAYGHRGQSLDFVHRRIDRLIELVDGVLHAGPVRTHVAVRYTAAVRASLADAEAARRIAREAGREARRGA
jgi:hypothetical protein